VIKRNDFVINPETKLPTTTRNFDLRTEGLFKNTEAKVVYCQKKFFLIIMCIKEDDNMPVLVVKELFFKNEMIEIGTTIFSQELLDDAKAVNFTERFEGADPGCHYYKKFRHTIYYYKVRNFFDKQYSEFDLMSFNLDTREQGKTSLPT